jgi:hypothetical protein
MSALAGLFVPGGHHYRTVADLIALLPRGMQHAATVAVRCVLRYQARNELEKLKPTDEDFAAESERMAREEAEENGIDYEGRRGYGPDFMQKGFKAIHIELGKLGVPLINRRSGIGMHGRRVIEVLPVLAGKKKRLAEPAAAGPPPGPPPGDRRDRRDTTTDAGSSSSLGSAPEETEAAREIASPELIARACKLVPKATPGRVIDAVARYGSVWLARVLDRVEERNRKPGNTPVRSWGFVLNTLANWKKEGGPPPADPAPAKATAHPGRRAAEEPPPAPMTAEELAELLELCRAGQRDVIKFSRNQLRKAVASGSVPAELVATIPAELLEPDPRAP